jgi:hypothetical protein
LEAARAKALADPVGAERAQRLAALLGHLTTCPKSIASWRDRHKHSIVGGTD